MAQKKMYPGVVNSPTTELSADITATQTSIAVLSVAGLLSPEGIATIGGGDSAETITYTSISGTTLQGCVRGFQNAARAWTAGVRVARNFADYDYNAMRENILDQAPLQGPTTNSGNAYSLSIPGGQNLEKFKRLTVEINADSTGAATLSYNGGSALPIRKMTGSGAVAVTNLKAGGIYTLAYTATAFILQGEGGEYGNAGAGDVRAGKTIGTDGGLVTGTVPVRATTSVTANGTLPSGIYDNDVNIAVPDPSIGTTDAVAADLRIGKKMRSGGALMTGTKPVQSTTNVTSNQTLPAGIYDNPVVVNVQPNPPTPGGVTIYRDDAVKNAPGTSLNKLFSCKVQIAGRYRLIVGSMYVTNSSAVATSEFRKSGVALSGSSRTTSSTSGISHYYDMTTDCAVGDTLELWGSVSTLSYAAYFTGFLINIADPSRIYITAT